MKRQPYRPIALHLLDKARDVEVIRRQVLVSACRALLSQVGEPDSESQHVVILLRDSAAGTILDLYSSDQNSLPGPE